MEKQDKRALLLSVGLDISAKHPISESIIQDIQEHSPQFISFLITTQSRGVANRIVKQLNLSEDVFDFIELPGPHDLRATFQKSKEAIRALNERGFSSDQISINYTSGTKVMCTGLVLAALSHSCNSLRYIKHDNEAKRAESTTTSPRSILAYHDLLTVLRLVENLQFVSAFRMLRDIDEELLGPLDLETLQDLRIHCQAYIDWENFRFESLANALPKLDSKGLIAKFKIDEKQAKAICSIAKSQAAKKYHPLIIADLFNHALRRWEEGRNDDATAHCYRCLEMLAQWVMDSEFEINTDKLDTRKVPARYRPKFEALRSIDDGVVKIGLWKSFELLEVLEHPLGDFFHQHTDTGKMLALRGTSFLAHGLNPMRKAECAEFIAWTADVINFQIKDFAEQCKELQFNWLKALNGQFSK